MNEEALAELARAARATISHEAAARHWGMRVAAGSVLPTLTVARNRSYCGPPGVTLHRRDLEPKERRIRFGVPVTSPLRTVLDLAATLPHADAVVSLDAALESQLVKPHHLAAALPCLRGPGATRARAVILAADGRSQSIPETLIRLWLSADARVGRVVPQLRLRVGGHPYDLGLPELRVVLEFQSWQWHQERSVWVRDARWGNQAYAAGWGFVQLVHEDVLLGSDHVRSLVLGLL